jgi:hypothetical protein
MDEWPRWSLTSSMCRPFAMSSAAHVCRKSWKRSECGRPGSRRRGASSAQGAEERARAGA